jgi:hypothetical protein
VRQDDLQIPLTLRPKLAGVDETVKAAMLKSSQALTLKTISATLNPAPKVLRKSRSIDSISSPKQVPTPKQVTSRSEFSHPLDISSNGPRFPSFHARGASVDLLRHVDVAMIAKDIHHSKKGNKDKDNSPLKLFGLLSSTSSTVLDVEAVKKLRLLLRNESAE